MSDDEHWKRILFPRRVRIQKENEVMALNFESDQVGAKLEPRDSQE